MSIYVVESNGGNVYIGKSTLPVSLSPQPTILEDCIFESGEYLGGCTIQVCAFWTPDEHNIKFYEEQLAEVLAAKTA